jgi:hypothetical protein
MPAMKQAPIFTPSGRSATFAPVVYRNTAAMTPNAAVSRCCPFRHVDSVTATAAELMSTRTPVA